MNPPFVENGWVARVSFLRPGFFCKTALQRDIKNANTRHRRAGVDWIGLGRVCRYQNRGSAATDGLRPIGARMEYCRVLRIGPQFERFRPRPSLLMVGPQTKVAFSNVEKISRFRLAMPDMRHGEKPFTTSQPRCSGAKSSWVWRTACSKDLVQIKC